MGKIKKKAEGKNIEKDKPFWKRRVERNIVEWRKDLGRVEEVRKGTKLKDKVMRRLLDKYDLLQKGCLAVVTLLKNKIQSGSVKIKHFTEKMLQHKQNTLSQSNQSQVYKELSGKTKTDNPSPDAAAAKAFWSGIWSEEMVHNGEAKWLVDVKEEMKEKVRGMADIVVKIEDVVKKIKGMSNWKAPGPDGGQGYWFKGFDCLHKPIVNALQKCIVEGMCQSGW